MPRVEPHLYADTPIFREMLYERDGRYPGTPEGEEPIIIALGPYEPPQGPVVHLPEPIEPSPPGAMVNRLVAVKPLPAIDPQETQPMRLPEL